MSSALLSRYFPNVRGDIFGGLPAAPGGPLGTIRGRADVPANLNPRTLAGGA